MANAKKLDRQKIEKDFLNKFESLCHSRNRWNVWNDLIALMAISLTNIGESDEQMHAKREEEYQAHAKSIGDLDTAVELFSLVMLALQENPRQDFLGNMYMRLNLGNKNRGQFFTPYHVCEAMASMSLADAKQEIENKGWLSVCDPTCGAGATLIAAANVLKDNGVNYQEQAIFVAQDIDRLTGMMCYVQLAALGCPGYVVIANSLTNPVVGENVLNPEVKEGQEFFFLPTYRAVVWNLFQQYLAKTSSKNHEE